jgi:hypothetical protein
MALPPVFAVVQAVCDALIAMLAMVLLRLLSMPSPLPSFVVFSSGV